MAPSIRSLLSFTNPLLGLFSSDHVSSSKLSLSMLTLSSEAPSCPADSPLSCHNTTVAPDSCCFIYPGGQLLQTQFWDTFPSVGPSDSWTLHGLWPDLCDGNYPTYCTAAPQYDDITSIIRAFNATALLTAMEMYWLPNRGTLESFWQHEWNKHGTCINTLAPSCYESSSESLGRHQDSAEGKELEDGQYRDGQEVIDFLTRTVALFSELNTYEALATAGIVPDNGRLYATAQVEQALRRVTGRDVVVRCQGQRLNEAWYSFNVRGSLQTGEFVPTEPVGKSGRSNCGRYLRYMEKGTEQDRGL